MTEPDGVKQSGLLRAGFWRAVRPAYAGLFYGLGRVINGISTGLGRLLEIIASDLFEELKKSRHARPVTVKLRIGEVPFKLWILGGHVGGQTQYRWLEEHHEVYEPVMVECLTRLIRQLDAPAFIDIGAFMGYYACYATALLGDKEPTYAVESNPRYVKAIERSIQANGFSNLRVLNAVLSDRVERAGIEREAVLFSKEASVSLETVTLDELCRREGIRPKIVKIDVHGAEGKVLFGMQELLASSVEYVLLEVHPNDVLLTYSAGITRRQILDLLTRLGFHVWYVAGHRYSRSDGLQAFLETKQFAYRRLDEETGQELLFDRHIDIFLLCSRAASLEPILGPNAGDPAWSGEQAVGPVRRSRRLVPE